MYHADVTVVMVFGHKLAVPFGNFYGIALIDQIVSPILASKYIILMIS